MAGVAVIRSTREVSRLLTSTDAWTYAMGILSLVGIWEFVGRVFAPAFLPPFTEVFARMVEELVDGALAGFLWSSLTNLTIGFALGASIGVTLGLAMGLARPVEIALESYVYGLMTAPSIVFVPIYFSIFGLARWSVVALIVQYTVFVIAVNTLTAVKQVNIELLEMAMVFGASRRQTILRVVLPASLPLTLTGLRIGIARALKGMVNGELLIALVGIGGQLVRFGNRFDAEGVLAVVLLIVILSLILLRTFWYIDRRLTRWVPSSQRH
jgi:NitT/TauT family transport system permease protein